MMPPYRCYDLLSGEACVASSYNSGVLSPTRRAVSLIRSSCVIFSPACKSNKSFKERTRIKTQRQAKGQQGQRSAGMEGGKEGAGVWWWSIATDSGVAIHVNSPTSNSL